VKVAALPETQGVAIRELGAGTLSVDAFAALPEQNSILRSTVGLKIRFLSRLSVVVRWRSHLLKTPQMNEMAQNTPEQHGLYLSCLLLLRHLAGDLGHELGAEVGEYAIHDAGDVGGIAIRRGG